ncbi:hypothetical protein LTS08_008421 [Lithohypha guttulata]|nr:hypothetical protein LTS08_008421 [Lithohypha guttulata]
MLAASSTRQMNPYLERALSIISFQSSSTIDHSYKTHLSRSKAKTMKKLDAADKIAAKRSGLIIDNASRSSVDDFLREPSAYELAISSQLTAAERVSEIIEDLKRQTTEEIDNWSWSLNLDYDPLEELKASPSTSMSTSGQSGEALFHDGHMVSSPISLLQTPVTVPNMASVFKTPATSEKGTKRGNVHTRAQSSTPETPKDPFTLSNKPSFQSFLSRVAKTPPPPPVTRDFAYPQSPSVSVLPEHSKKAETVTQAAVEPLRTTRGVKPLRQNYSKLIRSRTAVALPKSDLAAVDNSQSHRVVETKEPVPATRAGTRRSLPRSISTPLLRATESSNQNPSTKRKPLPKDSPLFVPLAEHPAFANLQPKRKGTKITPSEIKIKGTRKAVYDEDELDKLDVLLPLPPSPSSSRL